MGCRCCAMPLSNGKKNLSWTWLSATGKRRGLFTCLSPEALDEFYRWFEWMGVQRHFYVAGIFASPVPPWRQRQLPSRNPAFLHLPAPRIALLCRYSSRSTRSWSNWSAMKKLEPGFIFLKFSQTSLSERSMFPDGIFQRAYQYGFLFFAYFVQPKMMVFIPTSVGKFRLYMPPTITGRTVDLKGFVSSAFVGAAWLSGDLQAATFCRQRRFVRPAIFLRTSGSLQFDFLADHRIGTYVRHIFAVGAAITAARRASVAFLSPTTCSVRSTYRP